MKSITFKFNKWHLDIIILLLIEANSGLLCTGNVNL